MPVDYRDLRAFRAAVDNAGEAHGPITLAVCWVHDPVAPVLHEVADVLSRAGLWSTLVHVVGSSVKDPRAGGVFDGASVHERGVHYRRVVLGFKLEGAGRSRWLTHTEIAAGVIGAVRDQQAERIVGVVEPWGRRP